MAIENATVTENIEQDKIEHDENIEVSPYILENENIKIKKDGIIYSFFKRVLDIMGGIIGIVFLLPITIITYLLRVANGENDGPIFYEQLRIGKNGKEFKIYKYRTMVMHADEKLFKYLDENEDAREEYRKYKKLKEDPRITKVGKFLRRTSLDEFPQFINVLKGDMSLVGPRPYLYREKEDMGKMYDKIITCKPGITGYWQVNGRSEVDFKERLNMDLYYIKNKNLIMDFKILFQTIVKILCRKNGAI